MTRSATLSENDLHAVAEMLELTRLNAETAERISEPARFPSESDFAAAKLAIFAAAILSKLGGRGRGVARRRAGKTRGDAESVMEPGAIRNL